MLPEPEVWGAETPQRTKHEDHLSPRSSGKCAVRGLWSDAFITTPYFKMALQSISYAPPKQPKAPHRIPCFNQPTNAVHAKAETREPRGAQAALRETILSSANWPTCAEACQDQTSQVPSRKSWAQKVATTINTQVIEPNNIQAIQPLQTQYQARRPRSVLAVQDNRALVVRPTPLKTWADLFRNMKVVP